MLNYCLRGGTNGNMCYSSNAEHTVRSLSLKTTALLRASHELIDLTPEQYVIQSLFGGNIHQDDERGQRRMGGQPRADRYDRPQVCK